MIKLMKYELRKTMTIKLMILGATALAEIVFLIGLFANKNRMAAIGVGLLAMLAFGGVMIIGVASVVILHRDMNTKQSYMLFMTPNSSYRILGAKVLENGISILVAGAFFFAVDDFFAGGYGSPAQIQQSVSASKRYDLPVSIS